MARSSKQIKNMTDSELQEAFRQLKSALVVPCFGNRVESFGKYSKIRVDLDLVQEIAKKRGLILC